MNGRIGSALERLMERESLLWVCLVVQLLVYWSLAFLLSSGNDLVAYQRY
jgi:hypothetical protein